MNKSLLMISGSGASGTLTEDFRAVYEKRGPNGQPNYAPVPIMDDLAKVILGHGGGANKDTPLLELCHLTYAINYLDDNASNLISRLNFFVSPELASPGIFRDWFRPHLSASGGGINVHKMGLDIQYPEGRFSITYVRMPFLAALFEFLSSMGQFSFFEEFNKLLDTLSGPNIECEPITFRNIQDVSNRLSSVLRKYRREHLPRAQHDEKFYKIFNFLKERSTSGQLQVDDNLILDFWRDNSILDEFRVYKTVFENFVLMLQSLDEAEIRKSIDQAAPIGPDFENGEVEPGDDAEILTNFSEWNSPLDILDQEPVNRIKFFKQKNERRPIELLMSYGPYAIRLPLAFLRVKAFGPVQSGISNDLRLKRGSERVYARTSCSDAQTYSDIHEQFQIIIKHVQELKFAAFYAMQREKGEAGVTNVIQPSDNISCLFDNPLKSEFEIARTNKTFNQLDKKNLPDIINKAERAFKSVTRAGFTEEFLDGEQNIEAFRIGAGALIEIANLLDRFLRKSSAIDRGGSGFDKLFIEDRDLFSEEFRNIYGVSK